MNPTKNDWINLPKYLDEFAQITHEFIQTIEQRAVASNKQSIASSDLSKSGNSFDEVTKQLRENLIPYLSASRGPRYWGFVTGGATPIATFADWLVSTFDQNVSKGGDSISTTIERQTLTWLCKLFYLPSSFKGSLTTSATAANFLATIRARQYIGQKQVTYVANIKDSEKIDCGELEKHLTKSTSKGKMVIASAATVTATDFDDLVKIKALCNKHNAWLHVDAAFGIFERLINGSQGKTNGIELADSITLDCHKWLNVPYECGVFLTQHRQQLFESWMCQPLIPISLNM
ncbi:MAG: hypothetical protein COB83_05935 [Gammaproteobacteria bacterium]|nr:MAG: hypothetical protein COB83_05935 [Gammaproteobacteria bacterium]